MTPVVLIAEELAPAAIDVLAHDFDVRHVDGTDRPALLAALADADAVIVRSATQIDAEAIAAAPRLKVVARAGVGLDNVEVPAATARGVMVVNAPTSNIVSAAEQAVALLLAVARNTASASAALKAGEWKRSKYTGVEMQGKTVGVVGLGRIGVLFAQRIAAFGTRLIAYDPYIQPARAAAARRAPGRAGGAAAGERLHLDPPAEDPGDGRPDRREGAAARSSRACASSTPPAAGWSTSRRWPTRSPRAGSPAPASTSTPRSRAPPRRCSRSTTWWPPRTWAPPPHEAQDKAGLAVARSVKLALQGEFVPDAVNVQAGGVVAEDVRPLLPLAEKLGRVFTAVAGGVAASVTVEVRGEIVANDVIGAQAGRHQGPVRLGRRGAGHLRQRAACSRPTAASRSTWPPPPRRSTTRTWSRVRGALPDGRTVTVSGTVPGQRHPRGRSSSPRSTASTWSSTPSGVLLFFRYADRPGVVGTIGIDPRRGRRQHRRDAGGPARGRRRGADDADRRLVGRRRPAHLGRGRDRRRRGERGRPARRLSRSALRSDGLAPRPAVFAPAGTTIRRVSSWLQTAAAQAGNLLRFSGFDLRRVDGGALRVEQQQAVRAGQPFDLQEHVVVGVVGEVHLDVVGCEVQRPDRPRRVGRPVGVGVRGGQRGVERGDPRVGPAVDVFALPAQLVGGADVLGRGVGVERPDQKVEAAFIPVMGVVGGETHGDIPCHPGNPRCT